MTATFIPSPVAHASTDTTPTTSPVDDLRARTAGQVLTPDDPGFEAAKAAWNLRFTHRPSVVVVAESADDVAEAVRFARREGLALGVQSTGHGVARIVEGAVLVSTARLTTVEVDAQAATARVGGGVKWQPVLDAAALVGLAPLLGSTPEVGAVGYTLGGGMGWLARRYGLSLDHVLSFELVTPDGERRTASADEEPELFWALRGGGAGSLGIVTAMTIGLVPVTTVYGGNLLYPAEMAHEVVARYREWIEDAPEELTSSIVLMNFPPFEEVPEPIRGRSFVIVRGCWCGSLDEGKAFVDSWREWATPALDLFGPMPFSEVATISNDPVDPMPASVSTEWLNDLSEEVVDLLVDATFPVAGPPALIFSEVRLAGGAIARGTGTAFSDRASTLLLEVVGATPTPEIAEAVDAHIAALRAALAPHTTGGVYLNFCEGPEKRARSKGAFGAEAGARLAAVKDRIDPGDAMRFGVDLTA